MKFLSFLTLFVLLMQPFTYGFYKALCWQFEGRLKNAAAGCSASPCLPSAIA